MTESKDILLDVRDLQVHFEGDGPAARAVDGVNYKIHRRETVCIVGDSGCGTCSAWMKHGCNRSGGGKSPWCSRSP